MTIGTGRTTALMAILALSLAAAGLGCRAVPSDEGLSQTGPDPARDSREASVPETVNDPFGPDSRTGRLAESDLLDEMPAPAADAAWAEGRLETVYFDFDRSSLTEAARASLDRNAEFLLANPALRVRIEGHCDERGTVEYNLALGDRRANAARDYLLQRGVGATLLEVVSFGEERPADLGHSESAWARNRRAEFHVR